MRIVDSHRFYAATNVQVTGLSTPITGIKYIFNMTTRLAVVVSALVLPNSVNWWIIHLSRTILALSVVF